MTAELQAREVLPVAVLRRDLQELIDSVYNHIVNSKMVGLYSSTGSDMERALLKLPCLYCGGIGLAHTNSCDREFWRGKQSYERIIEEYRRSE